MPLIRSLGVLTLLGLIGSIVFFTQYSDYAPTASVDLQLTRPEIIELARAHIREMGYSSEGLDADANFIFDSEVALYLENSLGLAKAHSVLRADTLSAHNWYIYLFDRTLAPSQMPVQFRVWISPSGRVLGFNRMIPDTVSISSIESQEARILVEDFMQSEGYSLSRYKLENSSSTEHQNRTDYFFRWAAKDSIYRMTPKIWVRIQGDRISGYRHELDAPEWFQQAGSKVQTFVTFVITASTVATFVLVIFIISLFLKKYHEGEVGIKTAVGTAGFLFLLIVLDHVLRFTTIGFGTTVGDVNRFNVRLIVFFMTVLIMQLFMAAMVFAGWSVGESSARRGWGDKLKSIDGLHFLKPFTLEFASAAVRGYAFGFIILGILYGVTALVSGQTRFGAFTLPTLYGVPESYFASLGIVFLALRVAMLNEIVFRLFFISWLREKTKRIWPGLVISSLLWTLVAFTQWDFPLGFIPFQALFPAYFLISVFFGILVVRYDLLTAIFANFVVLCFTYAIPILGSSAPAFRFHVMIFSVLFAVPLVIAAVGFVRRQKFSFSLEITPAHILRISERERMTRELEIARTVQMSLLPKQNPLAEGYDIAGVCIPALEVGGDYYDFFQLGDGKIGIAIGDVSGKGVPAAIYMTLTKGILQSYASENFSPRHVLSKLNSQMYASIERSSFVSMFYAVLNMKSGTIRFARAGHNPAILAHRSNDAHTLLEPHGMALGLEAGDRFHTLLEEHEIKLVSGDVLTFYTDGFTEASTKEGAEYGEARLERAISEFKQATANGIIQSVVRSVKTFVGNHPQHDDMTMVVLKVL